MKMLIQFFAVLALVVCALSGGDYPPYADFGECETIQVSRSLGIVDRIATETLAADLFIHEAMEPVFRHCQLPHARQQVAVQHPRE